MLPLSLLAAFFYFEFFKVLMATALTWFPKFWSKHNLHNTNRANPYNGVLVAVMTAAVPAKAVRRVSLNERLMSRARVGKHPLPGTRPFLGMQPGDSSPPLSEADSGLASAMPLSEKSLCAVRQPGYWRV